MYLYRLSHKQQYRNVDIYTGDAVYFTMDSLSAFWPGLQVLAGDVQSAVKSHLICKVLFVHCRQLHHSECCYRLESLATTLGPSGSFRRQF
jgi:hypothetical protein